MENEYFILKPCCCHKDLPRLLKDNPDTFIPMASNGDVTIENLLHAVGYMIEGKKTLTIVTPTVNLKMMAYLKWAFNRDWLSRLCLLTTKKENIVKEVLSDISSQVHYITSSLISESSCMFILEGESGKVVVTGYISPSPISDDDGRARTAHHIAYYTQEKMNTLPFEKLTHSATAPFRIHGSIL